MDIKTINKLLDSGRRDASEEIEIGPRAEYIYEIFMALVNHKNDLLSDGEVVGDSECVHWQSGILVLVLRSPNLQYEDSETI